MKISCLRVVAEMASRRGVLAAALTAALSACASATIEEAVPQGALPRGPLHTGKFPNLNVPPAAAATQMSEEERAEALSELARERAAQEDGDGENAAAEEARLRRLADSHGEEVLRQIEGGTE